MDFTDGFEGGYKRSLMTDLYQITMCYGYWKSNKHDNNSVFELFFRKNPFGGEYAIFCGLSDCLKIVQNFRFGPSDLAYLREVLPPYIGDTFYEYLATIDCSQIKIWAIDEGSVVFPRVPLLIIEGPLAVVQLLETVLLNSINFASLVATNAVRFRVAVGEKKQLMEFGLRRAQGPDGAMSATKYSYIGGFDATSNVLAGKLYDIPVRGTHAHSFVNSFTGSEIDDIRQMSLSPRDGHAPTKSFHDYAIGFRKDVAKLLPHTHLNELNDGEFAAFCAFAMAFPTGFIALIDTYDVLKSGVVNFCACSLALNQFGYKAVGVRIDSGDLTYLSRQTRAVFHTIANEYNLSWFQGLSIVASNDLNENTLYSLESQKNEINSYGIGTHLVTCQKQPALGCVFKLVEVNGSPRMKLSHEIQKVTIPGKKVGYRLFGKDDTAIDDIMTREHEDAPKPGESILCRHVFEETKRVRVMPSRVQRLHNLYYSDGKLMHNHPSVEEIRMRVKGSIAGLREDHKRNMNPTPYKVSVSDDLYKFFHDFWLDFVPVSQLD